ncbi:MAG: hypothetical protein HZA94_02730 [Candidatus Vogelbacteria bacterium]|nr:hypothetical protein [Candidatus Vogelbacteria bacterium]
MENLTNKNVIVSVLAGILIIFGAFLSSQNKASLSDIDATGGEISYSKNSDDNAQNVEAEQSDSGGETETKIELYRDPKPHALGELEIIDDTSRALGRSYGIELAKILGKYAGAKIVNPVEIINEIYETKNYSETIKLLPVKESYFSEIKDLAAIRIPKNISVTHLNLINNIDRMGQLLENMDKIESDELLGVASAKQFALETNIQIALLQEINKYYADKNISFGSTEKADVYENVIR